MKFRTLGKIVLSALCSAASIISFVHNVTHHDVVWSRIFAICAILCITATIIYIAAAISAIKKKRQHIFLRG